MAAHSSSSDTARSAAPAATMSPMVARIRQVIPAAVAMNTHLSHISCRMALLARASALLPVKAATIASIRGVTRPSRSPNDRVWASFRCRIRPSSSSVAEITHWPPSTARRPKRVSSRSRWRMPFSSGRIAVSGPTAGANNSIAPGRSYALQLSRTRSNGPRKSSASTMGAGRSTLPRVLRIDSPVRASCPARRWRTRKVTSRPASSRRPPK